MFQMARIQLVQGITRWALHKQPIRPKNCEDEAHVYLKRV